MQGSSTPGLDTRASSQATKQDTTHLYRGRFAPSPTGALHFGSLVAATGSYLQAKTASGQWLVRIEDVDLPRSVPGADELILRTLEAFGFEWDESVTWQSRRTQHYEHALQLLQDQDLVFPCSCTRSELQTAHDGADVHEELRYPGWCRNGPRRQSDSFAWRFRVPADTVSFVDRAQGPQAVDLQASIGDFVVKRRDGLFAYQLAVVVDDFELGMTEVVRGADLLSNTPRQIALQRALGFTVPNYLHLPVAVNAQGHKLSKSTAATALTVDTATSVLWQTLQFLQQAPPHELQHDSLGELWRWALANWRPHRFSGLLQRQFPG